MSIVWNVVVPVAQALGEQGPDPEDVKPGWLGFAVFLLLAAAVAFLAFSFVKQLRKARANFDARDAAERAEAERRAEESGREGHQAGQEAGHEQGDNNAR